MRELIFVFEIIASVFNKFNVPERVNWIHDKINIYVESDFRSEFH